MKRAGISVGFAMIAMACYKYCSMATYLEVITSTATSVVVDGLGTSMVVGHLLSVMVVVIAPTLIALYAYQALETSRSPKKRRAAATRLIAALVAPVLLTLVVSTWPFSFLLATIAFVIMTAAVSVMLLRGLFTLDEDRV